MVIIRVRDEVAANARLLLQARREAERIFAHAGIDLVWLTCNDETVQWNSDSRCHSDRGPSEFWVRIVARRLAGGTEDVLGFTELNDQQSDGIAGVYYPAAIELARQWQARSGDIVGAAIAHEIGHLLLGANVHTQTGVMQAHWSRLQVESIEISEMNFAVNQEKLLRERIALRIRGNAR